MRMPRDFSSFLYCWQFEETSCWQWFMAANSQPSVILQNSPSQGDEVSLCSCIKLAFDSLTETGHLWAEERWHQWNHEQAAIHMPQNPWALKRDRGWILPRFACPIDWSLFPRLCNVHPTDRKTQSRIIGCIISARGYKFQLVTIIHTCKLHNQLSYTTCKTINSWARIKLFCSFCSFLWCLAVPFLTCFWNACQFWSKAPQSIILASLFF